MRKTLQILISAAVAFAPTLVRAEALTVRGVIRTGVDRSGRVHGEFKKVSGLANATSINYKLLLRDKDGKERFVNEKDTTFKFGQQFRLQIEADTDMFIYVFHEGPDGVRQILIPDTQDKGDVPMVKQGQVKQIPDDNTFFEFAPPAGKERIMVLASPTKRPELTPKEAFDSKSDSKKLLELKTKQDELMLDTKANLSTQKSNNLKQVIENAKNEEKEKKEKGFRLRGIRWEPEVKEATEGRTVLVGSFDEKDRPEVFVEINLSTK